MTGKAGADSGATGSTRASASRILARCALPERAATLTPRAWTYTVLAAAAISLLPWWARLPLRLPLLPVTEAVVVRPASRALMELIRWSLAPSSPQFDVSEAMAAG